MRRIFYLTNWQIMETNIGVYKAINSVQSALAKTGISKDRTNTQGSGYKFRGIDDVYNAISPLLAEHGLCILPRMLSRNSEERQSKSGSALFYVTVHAEFDFVAASDGSKHTVATYGEAMDSGDKATNKAMSAAYKYAAFQAFAIPTEGDNDADAQTHEVKPNTAKQTALDEFEKLSPVDKDAICAAAKSVIDAHAKGAWVDVKEFDVQVKQGGADWYLAYWSQLPSNVRTFLKDQSKKAA